MYFAEHRGADLLSEAIALRVIAESGIDAEHLQCLLEASRHRQVMIVKTEKNEPLASLTFARISKFTLNLLAKNPKHKLCSYEYCEGTIIYVLDAFFRRHAFRRSLALLVPQLKRSRIIAYVRKGRLRVLYNNRGSFKLIKLSALNEK